MDLRSSSLGDQKQRKQIKCIIGDDYKCNWSGEIKDFSNHVEYKHYMHFASFDFNNQIFLEFENFLVKSWTSQNHLHIVNGHMFIICTSKSEERFDIRVKLLLDISPDPFYYLVSFWSPKTKDDSHTMTTKVEKVNEKLEPTELVEGLGTLSFPLQELARAVDEDGSLMMVFTAVQLIEVA